MYNYREFVVAKLLIVVPHDAKQKKLIGNEYEEE